MINRIQKDLYSDIIQKIRCGSYRGHSINAKPILLYSVIEMIENGMVLNNKIPFDANSEKAYQKNLQLFGVSMTPFFKPFYYLQYDGFWHLEWKSDIKELERPSAKQIRENVKYAYLDNALWDLLQEKDIRDTFRKSIENHYLK